METDSEHSFKLTLVCWYIIEKLNLSLDKTLVMKYALSHDLVEIHAGDTDAHNASSAEKSSKEKRELKALEIIKSNWPDFSDLTNTIQQYENLETKESEFVYLMDKIQPVINTYLSNHPYYMDSGVTYEKYLVWLASKENKLNNVPDKIRELLTELKQFLEENSNGLFAKAT